MLKLYTCAMKISIIHSQHSLPFFKALKSYTPKALKIRFGFRIIQFIIHEMAFKLCILIKARAGKVKKVNNQNLYRNWINLPSGN